MKSSIYDHFQLEDTIKNIKINYIINSNWMTKSKEIQPWIEINKGIQKTIAVDFC